MGHVKCNKATANRKNFRRTNESGRERREEKWPQRRAGLPLTAEEGAVVMPPVYIVFMLSHA